MNYYCATKFTDMYVDVQSRQVYNCCKAMPERINLEWLQNHPGHLFNTPTMIQDRKLINSQGVRPDTLLNQIRAELLWNKIVRGRYGSYVSVNEDEVSIVYDRTIESIGKDQYEISEIFCC